MMNMDAAALAELKAEIKGELRAEMLAEEEAPPPLKPVVMEKVKFGRESAEAVRVDRESVASLADKHGKDVLFDHRRGRCFALPGVLDGDEETRFYVGGWYVERDGREPGWMTDEEFQAAKG